MEQEKEYQIGDLIRKIGFLIKKNWILITAVILVFVLGGAGYSYLRKPTYIAGRTAVYSAKLSSDTNIYDHTITANMLPTFVDFCDEDVVVKRANYYYDEYLTLKKATPNYKVNDYVEYVEAKKAETFGKDTTFDQTDANYDADEFVPSYVPNVVNNEYKLLADPNNQFKNTKIYEGVPVLDEFESLTEYDFPTYIKASDVSVSAIKTEDVEAPRFDITVTCKDENARAAKDKAEIYVLAIKYEASKPTLVQRVERYKESNDVLVLDEVDYIIHYEYFEARINLKDVSDIGCATDTSRMKILLIAGVLGVVAACIAVAFVCMLDRTVRSKEELESITNSNVLAIINTNEEGK